MSKPNGPHQGVVNIRYEIYETMPNGKATGIPVDRGSKLRIFSGKNKEEVQVQVTAFMESINDEERKSKQDEGKNEVVQS